MYPYFNSHHSFLTFLVRTKNYVQVTPLLRYRYLCTQRPADENLGVHVYHGILSSQIRTVKLLTFCSSVGGIGAQAVIYDKIANLGTLTSIFVCSFFGFFTFVTPFLIHCVTKKYVTDIYFNPNGEEYAATVYTFFLKKKLIKFTPDDVKVPDVPGLFTSFYAKGEPLFIDPRLFEDPGHYTNIMGFNKPLDFKLGKSESIEKKKE